MSYTKHTLEHFSSALNGIFEQTKDDNDLTELLESLNCLMEIGERFSKHDSSLEFYWNEIISDSISIIYSGTSGQYRTAKACLRNILELAASSFFYYDHKIELHLFTNEDFKADKYVSSLIHEFHFFKSNYIRSFFNDIDSIQTSEDSVSSYLSLTYAKLCDIVHGRYRSLTKVDGLKIEYSKEQFKIFEQTFYFTVNAISLMYVLRFKDFSHDGILKFARKSNAIS